MCFFTDTATTENYARALDNSLPILDKSVGVLDKSVGRKRDVLQGIYNEIQDPRNTRLGSGHIRRAPG